MKLKLFLLLAVTVLLSAESAFAAKCSFREDTNDFFSGVQTLRTEWAPLNPASCQGECNARASMSMVQESGDKRIEFDVWFSISSVFVPTQAKLDDAFIAPAGTRLQITLADGTLVELPSTSPVEGQTKIKYPYEDGNDNYVTRVSALFDFALNEIDASALSAQKATTVRVLGANRELTVLLEKKEQGDFMEPIVCLREEKAK